jgi:hypothetical protein
MLENNALLPTPAIQAQPGIDSNFPSQRFSVAPMLDGIHWL